MSSQLKSLLGSDSDDSDDDEIGTKAKPPQPKSVPKDDDSDSDSDSDDSSDDEDFNIKKKAPKAPPKKGDDASSKKRKAPASSEPTKKKKGLDRIPKKKSASGKGSGDEYDSEPEDMRTKEDDAFIDSDDDDRELLKEYSKDRQDFHDERPDDEDDPEGGRGGRDNLDDEPTDPFEKMLKKIKHKKKRSMTSSEKEELAKALCHAMDTAAEKDENAIENGQPAFSKIKKLQFVMKQLKNEETKDTLLDYNILKCIKRWIEPNGDVVPNLTVRTQMLKALDGLHVEVDHLRSSNGLGRAVTLLSHYKNETVENKTMCRHLINKWNRLVFNKSDNFRGSSYTPHEMETNEGEAEGGGEEGAGKRKASRASSLNSLHKSPSGKSKKARDPDRPSYIRHDLNFTRAAAPRKVVENVTEISKDSTKGRLRKSFTDLRRPHNKNLKSMKMSIEGRVVQN